MNCSHRSSAVYTAITWMLVGLIVDPKSQVLGQESSTYVHALEVLLAPATASSRVPGTPAPILMAAAQTSLLPSERRGEGERVATDPNLVLQLTRTAITLTNGHELLGLSFFSDSNHNYVVEFRNDIGFDLCNQWQPLTNAPHNYGIVFTESQATNRFFRLRRIDTPRAPLFALLAHDTGTNSIDGITSDPTITGLALKFPAGTELRANLDNPVGPFTVITNLGSPHYFLFTRGQIATLNGGSLPDGPHTLHLRAMNGGTTFGSFDLPFTLDTAPPTVTVSLAPAFDSPPLGDGRTAFNPVTLNGQTEPGTRLELLASTSPGGPGAPVLHQITPDANGRFVLTNVVLAQGTNQFFFRALDAACNETISEARLCWYGSDCSFPDNLAGWQVAVSPAVGIPGSVTVAPDELCTAVLTEGDSFLVTLSRDFLMPTIPSVLSLNYQATFDTSATHLMRDAFEVALVDAASRPLTYTIQGTNAVTPASVATPSVLPPSPDTFFNHTDGQAPFVAPGAVLTSQPSTPQLSTILVDVRHLPPGSTARLILRLVNNDRDRATRIHISDIRFMPVNLALPFGGSLGTAFSIAHGTDSDPDTSSAVANCGTFPFSFNSASRAMPFRVGIFGEPELGPQLLRNPSFEMVPSATHNQGVLPSEWLPYESVVPGADTYSMDGSFGLSTGDYGQFVGASAADGLRWVAGAEYVRGEYEGFLQRLDQPLLPGRNYLVRGQLRLTTNPIDGHRGGYRVFFSASTNVADEPSNIFVGTLADATNSAAWELRSFLFTAPTNAASLTNIIFRPFTSEPGYVSYIGIDDLLLALQQTSSYEISPPQLVVSAPADHARLTPGTALLTGYALAERPDILGILATNRVTLVAVNGSPVDALDAAGNFFSIVEVKPGQNVFAVVATDAFNQSTTNHVTVYGTTCPQNFASLGEVSASVVPEYGRTSFNEWTKVLYADLALRNVGTYHIRAPFYVGVTRISDPSVRLLAPDGVSADGIHYYDFTETLNNGLLNIGSLSAPRALAFHNPNQVQFTYDLVVLGQLNQAPAFTTAPVLEAIVGKPYAYPFYATDPDGDSLTYSLLSGPSGMVLNAGFSTLNFQPSTNDLGTHDISLHADDGKGGIAEQHYRLSVINQPSNRPPYFVSTPVTVARLSTPSVGVPEVFDVSKWSVLQYEFNSQGPASWIFSGTNVARQVINADASILVSDIPSENTTIEGTFRVNTDFDYDYIGFVFGFQDIGHYYLFDWRQLPNSAYGVVAEPGMNVKVVRSDSTPMAGDLYASFAPDTNRVRTIYHNAIPWEDYKEYQFTLQYTPGHFVISIRDQTNTLASIDLFDDTYSGGRFGFYNFSQNEAVYQGFDHRSLPVATYVYDADAADPDGDELTYGFATSSRYAEAVLQDRPVGYWRLGENDGNVAADSSGHDNPGRYVGDVRLGSPGALLGDSDNSAQFDGGRIDVLDSPVLRPPALTLEAWINAATLPLRGSVLTKTTSGALNDGYGMLLVGNSMHFFVSFSDFFGVNSTLSNASWNHVVGTYDGNTIKLYINGQPVASTPHNRPLKHTTRPLQIGYTENNWIWRGALDEVAIYDKALSAEAVQKHYDSGHYGAPAVPKGMSIDQRTGLIRWEPTAAQIGTHNVSLEVNDGRGGSNTQSYVICVLPDLTPVFTPESVDLSVSAVDTLGLRFDGQALTVSGTASATIANKGQDDVRRPFDVMFFEDRNTNGVFDSGVDNVLGRTVVSQRLSANSEIAVAAPVSGACRFAGIPVWAFVDSTGTVLEIDESNNIGRNACESAPPVRQFNPVVKWKKDRFVVNPESDQVILTPAVADLDHDGIPEIIFSTYASDYSTDGLLRAIRGTDGIEVWTVTDTTNRIIAAAGLAVGDIDNDDQLEIVAVHADTSLIAFNHDGSFKWKSTAQIGTAENTIFPYQWGAPSLADLDHDGRPEIILGAMVFDANGALRWQGRPGSGKGNFGWGYLSTVVDLDLDGLPEVLAGNTAYRADGTVYWDSYLGDGLTAVGNFDEDPFPEIVLVGGGRLYLLNHDGTIKWERLPPNVGTGAPIVADLDGDGRPEIGLATPASFDVFDSNGAPKWSMPTFDGSSYTTGASAFDFDGDGRAEVVYSDEASLSIFRGSDGDVLFRLPKSSCTCSEYPVIADVDGDGTAEIVTVANTSCGWGQHQGIRLNGIYVIGDSNNTWVSTRPMWNQYSYHINNVNDDGTIPRYETNSWQTHNTYRANLPLPAANPTLPDLVPSFASATESNGTVTLTARIGNGGSKGVRSGLSVAFYDGDPRSGGKYVAKVQTTASLASGAFEDVALPPITNAVSNLWIVADDDGSGNGRETECNEANNFYHPNIPPPAVNHLPEFTSTPIIDATEGQSYRYDADALDADTGDSLTFSLAFAPAGMSIDAASGVVTWLPNETQNGRHSVVVTVADSRGAQNFQSFSIQVQDAANASPGFVSTPPVIAFATQLLAYEPAARDADGDALRFDLVVAPAGMILDTNVSTLIWRPLLSQLGTHDVILRVQDGRGGVALQSWQITVVAPNSPPFITTFPPGPAVVELPYRYVVRAQDTENQPLTFSLASNAPFGISLTAGLSTTNSALLSWTPALSNLGPNEIEFIVRDSEGAEARQTFNLEVVASSPNRPPAITSTPRTQARVGGAYAYVIEVTDPDGDPVSVALVSGPAGMVLTNAPELAFHQSLLYWPVAEFGPHGVQLRASDGRNGTAEQQFTLNVSSSVNNQPPLITSLPLEHATAGQTYDYQLEATDPDGDVVTWRVVSGPVGMSLDSATGRLLWNPTLDQLGTNNVIVEAGDALFATTTQTFSIDVGCLNRPPQITSAPPTAAQTGAVYLYAPRGSDPDEDRLSWSLVPGQFPAGMTIDGTNGLIRWNPTTNQIGSVIVSVKLSDGRGGNDTQTFTLYASDLRANKAPIIVSTPLRGATVGRPYTYTLRATDADGDTLTLSSLLMLPTGATFTPSPGGQGLLVWTPEPAQQGQQEFILTARDPAGASASQRFFVTVRSNQPPVITSAPRTNAVPGVTYRYDVSAFDPDGDALAYAFASPVPSGMGIDSLGRIAWTPSQGQTGTFPITVMAFDGFGGTGSQSFAITVAADTEPPQVSLALVQGLVNPANGQWAGDLGTTVRVRIDASDNVGVASRALYLGTNALPLDASYTASILVDRGGVFNFTGSAVDFSGNTNSTTRPILFRDPNATSHVFVQIHTPTNDSVITQPVGVVATITNESDLVSYSWGYALAADVDLSGVSITDPAFTVVGTTNLPPGIRSLTNIVVGRFDPTVLNNDAYVIAVAGSDANGNTWTEPVVVSVQGNLKFGEFRLEFTDLAIPVAGIPITITRVYDTRDARRVGEFGHGWSLGVQDAKIRKTLVDRGWGPTMFPGSRVYVTKPDGQRVGFTAYPASVSCFGFCFASVGLRPDAGVYDKLAIVDDSATYFGGMFLGGLADSPYSPTGFRLTTKDGTVYSYEESVGLTNVTDLNGNRLEYTRDGIFHFNAGSATADQSVRFIRDTRGRISQIIDPNGKALTYAYDALGDLRSFSDQVTNSTRYAYSASRAHFLTNIVDPLGRSALSIEYDSTGRLKTVRDANGNPISQDFDIDSKSATFTDGNGTIIHARFDDHGNELVRRIEGVSTNYFAYDSNNNLLTSTNGRGFSTNYTFDARGNVTAITDSLNNRTTIAYNELNKPVGVINALGQTLHLSYSSSGQLTQVVNNAGFKTSVTRDAQSRVVSLTDATGTNTTIFDYSNGCACGRPGKVINPDGSFRLYEYNSQGLTNRVVNELGAETFFHHDDSGKLLWMRDPLTNFTQFFYNGPLLTNVVDALGRSTRYEYDSLNRTNKIIDAENGVVEFRYDNNGNRTHVIDAVTNVTTFVYDAGNRLKMQIDPLGHTNFFGYDAVGNRTEAIDRNGRRRTFAYDAANRMTNELWWEGTNVVRSIVFGFNELGVQTLAADPAARYEYTYDALNRLERVLSQSAGVPDFTLLYTYTVLGQVASVTDHWGVRVGSGYDNRNRLAGRTWSSTLPGAGVDPARVDFAYDVSGNRLRTDRFADLAGTNRIGFTTNAYNRAGIVTNITHLGPASQVLAKYDYNFDAAYQITRWAIGNQLSDFAYNRTGQLTNALNTARPDEHFRFDANGNRVGAQSGGSYVVGGNNQILSDGTNRYAYDAEGNMTSRSNTVTGVLTGYQFDHRNRLVNVLDRNPGGVVTQTVAFVYDAMNRRLSKTVNGPQNTNVVRFLYNRDDSWADLDGTNAVTARYLHGARIDELLARQRASDGRGWYLTDHLGTVRDIANAAGVVVAHADYSSFGQVLGVSNPGAVDRFLFTARELDRETGLQFFRARYYSTQIGRFVSQDPIGFRSDDHNLYRYLGNAPFAGVDPTGHQELLNQAQLFVLGTGLLGAIYGAVTAPECANLGDFGEVVVGGFSGFIGGVFWGIGILLTLEPGAAPTGVNIFFGTLGFVLPPAIQSLLCENAPN